VVKNPLANLLSAGIVGHAQKLLLVVSGLMVIGEKFEERGEVVI